MKRISLTVVVGALFLSLFAGVALAATISCAGDRLNCNGTSSADVITGTNERDVIRALAGNDTVNARQGNDEVNAGPDSDTVDGGEGDDLLQGSSGKDDITGGDGRDEIFGGKGSDTIRARDGFRDEIHCDGGRNDKAIIDNKDVIANKQDCETIKRP